MRYSFILIVAALTYCGLSQVSFAQNKVVVIPLLGDGSTWRGAWQKDIAYRRSDIVERDGSSYIVTANHISSRDNVPANDSFWDLVAASGDQGGQLTVNAPLNFDQDSNTLSFDVASTPASNNLQPSLGLNYICALVGLYPSRSFSEPFVGQVALVGFNFAPRGWSFCSGQLLPISSNSALFSLYGTFYGGDGRTTFALPDLRGRSVIGAQGNATGPGLQRRIIGGKYGTEQVRF